jgi:UDP-N-acetylmuramate dehydrogenase
VVVAIFLFTRDFDGIVVHLQTKGITIIRQSQHAVLLKVCAGENWHELGHVELRTGLCRIGKFSFDSGKCRFFSYSKYRCLWCRSQRCHRMCRSYGGKPVARKIIQSDCQFGYRDSIFKKSKGKYIVTAVNFHLKKNQSQVNTTYGAIQSVLVQKGNLQPTALDIANTVIQIRQSKLPDPKVLGNSGSFLKIR